MRVVSIMLQPCYDMERMSVPIEEEAVWAVESVWIEEEKILPLPGFEPHGLVTTSAPVNGVLRIQGKGVE
jgi:hypothetical protein